MFLHLHERARRALALGARDGVRGGGQVAPRRLFRTTTAVPANPARLGAASPADTRTKDAPSAGWRSRRSGGRRRRAPSPRQARRRDAERRPPARGRKTSRPRGSPTTASSFTHAPSSSPPPTLWCRCDASFAYSSSSSSSATSSTVSSHSVARRAGLSRAAHRTGAPRPLRPAGRSGARFSSPTKSAPRSASRSSEATGGIALAGQKRPTSATVAGNATVAAHMGGGNNARAKGVTRTSARPRSRSSPPTTRRAHLRTRVPPRARRGDEPQHVRVRQVPGAVYLRALACGETNLARQVPLAVSAAPNLRRGAENKRVLFGFSVARRSVCPRCGSRIEKAAVRKGFRVGDAHREPFGVARPRQRRHLHARAASRQVKRAATQAVAFEKHNLRLRRRQKGGGVRGASFYAAPARRLVVSRVRGGGGVDVRVLARALGARATATSAPRGCHASGGACGMESGSASASPLFFFFRRLRRAENSRASPRADPPREGFSPAAETRPWRGTSRVLPLPDAQLRSRRRARRPATRGTARPRATRARDAVAAAAADGRLGEHAELLGHQDERSGPRGENRGNSPSGFQRMARRPCATRPTHSGVMSLVKTAPGAINASSSSSGSGATKSNSRWRRHARRPQFVHEREARRRRATGAAKPAGRRLGGVRRVVRDVISKGRRRRSHLRWWIWWIGRLGRLCGRLCLVENPRVSFRLVRLVFFRKLERHSRALRLRLPGVSNASVADGTDSEAHLEAQLGVVALARAVAHAVQVARASVTAYVTRDSAS